MQTDPWLVGRAENHTFCKVELAGSVVTGVLTMWLGPFMVEGVACVGWPIIPLSVGVSPNVGFGLSGLCCPRNVSIGV